MKIKHKVTISVYEDDTVDYEFEGADGWSVGKLQRQLTRAIRHLKAEHRVISQKQKAAAAKAAEEQAEDRAAQKAVADEAESLGKRIRNEMLAGDKEMADTLKGQLHKLLGEDEGEEDADDTGTDGGDAGKTSKKLGSSSGGAKSSDGKSN